MLVQVVGCATTLGMRNTSKADNLNDVTVSVQLGAEYEIVGELYVHEVATDLKKRTVDYMVLVPLRLSGPEILSRRLVPAVSRVRVLERRARQWPAFLYSDKFVVEVDAIASTADAPVLLGLSRGNEGKSGSLNPSIYRHLK